MAGRNLARVACWVVCAALGGAIVIPHARAAGDAEDRSEQEASHGSPHAFLVPMGVPGRPGSYDVQVSPFAQTAEGETEADAGAHASFGMFDWGGLHLRSLGLRTFPVSEIIGMGALLRDRRKEQGLSAIAILGVPTRRWLGEKKGEGSSQTDEHGHGGETTTAEVNEDEWAYLLGLSGRLAPHPRLTVDGILHYDFTARHWIPETGLVFHAWRRLFAVLDLSGSVGDEVEAYALPGAKIRLSKYLLGGMGFRFPLTNASSFDRQIYLQIEISRH